MTSYYCLLLLVLGVSAAPPTLYEYYTGDGINSGLSADQPYFTLNGKNITILSGAMHYFRIPPQYWRDRLRKLRAAGLNAVETYVAWNLHEPQNGLFDFGDGGTDMEQFLDLRTYIKLAQEEDLFVILRPGPYICAEWEWGGFPSWLLREDGIMVRTSDPVYMNYVERYFNKLLSLVEDLQFTKGGPIIAVQVENEYGSAPTIDLNYMRQLYDLIKGNGIVELLVSSDSSGGNSGTLPDLLLMTVNFGGSASYNFDQLKKLQPDKPTMAMEFWTGWFDHWSEVHHTVDNNTFRSIYEDILSYPASASMYMFHGGTNWGFLNGANILLGNNVAFQPTTTSYDYDAPLSEAGDYTDKYTIVKELIEKYYTVETLTPDQPELIQRVQYPSVAIEGQLGFSDIVDKAPIAITTDIPLPMEKLPINNNSGQSYGYTIYRRENLNIPAGSVLTIEDHVRDTVMVLVNGVLISSALSRSADLNGFGYYRIANSNITLATEDLEDATLDLVIENCGRGNFGPLYQQFKGLLDVNDVYLNDEILSSWLIIPLEFKKSWNTQLSGWKTVDGEVQSGPGLYKATLTLEDEPTDTYIDLSDWDKGITIVNGFVLGRHAKIGPQQSLYLPGPFLKKGDNEIVVFEHFNPATEIKFSQNPIFNTIS